MNCKPVIATFVLSLSSAAAMAELSVPMKLLDENGASKDAGTVTAVATEYGVVFTPKLAGLTPGLHGFHVHQNPDCGPSQKDGKNIPGGAAGGHYDPAGTQAHGTPWGKGHLGDLPPLFVDADGSASQPVLAPRLKLADLSGRALMIHAGGDNHSDHPAKLGGGGARMACGVAK